MEPGQHRQNVEYCSAVVVFDDGSKRPGHGERAVEVDVHLSSNVIDVAPDQGRRGRDTCVVDQQGHIRCDLRGGGYRFGVRHVQPQGDDAG